MILSKTYIQLLKGVPRSQKALEKSKAVVKQKKLYIFFTKDGPNQSKFCQNSVDFFQNPGTSSQKFYCGVNKHVKINLTISFFNSKLEML